MYIKSGKKIDQTNNLIMNIGKIFERQIKKSVPDYALLCRLPDSAQSFGGSNNLRFSRKNPFDYILYDSKTHLLYALELKTVKGKSISFERTENDVGEIHYNQIQGLNEWNRYDGVICGFLIEFREIEKTFFLKIDDFNKLLQQTSKKSFNNQDLEKFEINHTTLSQTKAKKYFTYDIDELLKTESLIAQGGQ